MSSPPPLTASEKALADVKAAEAEESRREQLGGAQRRGNAVVPVKMKWSEELIAALKGLNEVTSGEEGKIVCVVSNHQPRKETDEKANRAQDRDLDSPSLENNPYIRDIKDPSSFSSLLHFLLVARIRLYFFRRERIK